MYSGWLLSKQNLLFVFTKAPLLFYILFSHPCNSVTISCLDTSMNIEVISLFLVTLPGKVQSVTITSYLLLLSPLIM